MPMLDLALYRISKSSWAFLNMPGLRKMLQVWNQEPTSWNHSMLSSVYCGEFVRFLLSEELTDSKEKFDANYYLSFKNIAVDNTSKVAKVLPVHIKQSKTDPFWQEVNVFWLNEHIIGSPVSLPGSARSWRGPTFCFENGQQSTCSFLVAKARQTLQSARMQAENYVGHSFCDGVATRAAACRFPVDTIKTLKCLRN